MPLSELPVSHLDMLDTPPAGMVVTQSLCSPVINIREIDERCEAILCASVFKKGQTLLIEALSLDHNWVADGKFVKPLPADISVHIKAIIGDADPSDLAFKDVLRIRRDGRSGQFPVSVVIEKSILDAASTRSLNYALKEPIEGLEASLYPYQEQGVAWMQDTLRSLDGVILADEMGLGKTLQIIALFLLEKPTKETPALIVCPTSLIANWCNEIMKFAPRLTFMIHRGSNRAGICRLLKQAEVVITTYDTMVNDRLLLSSVEWTYVVCDEAQALKTPTSNRRRAIVSLPRKYTIPVTGTPVENSLLDLWSLLDFSIPGLLGTQEEFEAVYPDSEDSADALSQVVDPVILKRQLSDVAQQLPERTNVDIPIEMDPGLAADYERTRREVLEKYPKAGQLVATGQLALFCAHPWLQAKDPEAASWEDAVAILESDDVPLETPKIRMTIELLTQAFRQNKKVILFAAYNNCREIIEKAIAALPAKSFPEAYWNAVNGSTPAEDRQRIIDEYSTYSGPAILVLNPKAAGSGLNIQAATIVIHYTQYWNPALEMQASARSHRTGQENPVTVYYLYYKDSIEEVMLARTEWKRAIAGAAIPITTREDSDLANALSLTPVIE